jgi:hypothetical protein
MTDQKSIKTDEAPTRKYAKEEIVFIRCRVVNYDFDTKSYDINEKVAVQNPDRGEYLLETVDKMGRANEQSRTIWIIDGHLVSLEEAKRAVRR